MTVRDRDSLEQIRVPIGGVRRLLDERLERRRRAALTPTARSETMTAHGSARNADRDPPHLRLHGDTAARVARAAQTQFSGHRTTVVRHPRVTTVDDLASHYGRVASRSGVVIFYTLVDRTLRRALEELCQRDGMPCCDLLGPPLEALAAAAGHEADLAPGRPIGLDADYFQRIAAMEFVVKHDDGLNGEGLEDADIVLIGVSRTGKTPLSMYLGFQGYKTANVPLVRGIEPPGKLFQIDRAAHRRADDRGRAARADPRPAHRRPRRRALARRLRRAEPHPRGARAGQRAAAAPRLPGARRLEPRGRGGRGARDRARRGPRRMTRHLRLRLRRRGGGPARAARRQGRRARRDDAARPAGARRLHDHDGRVRARDALRRRLARRAAGADRRRARRARAALRPAARRRAARRCSCRCAAARRSRCRG